MIASQQNVRIRLERGRIIAKLTARRVNSACFVAQRQRLFATRRYDFLVAFLIRLKSYFNHFQWTRQYRTRRSGNSTTHTKTKYLNLFYTLQNEIYFMKQISTFISL